MEAHPINPIVRTMTSTSKDILLEEDNPSELAFAAEDAQPTWVPEELPPEYAEIARKIANLRQEARKYEKFTEVLWRTGTPLKVAVREIFSALDLRAELTDEGKDYDLAVELEPQGRLLVEVLGGSSPLEKKSPDIVRALRAIQEESGPGDRVVLVANVDCDKPVAMRQQPPATPEALRLIQGLGANLVATSTLFGLWRQSLRDPAAAKNSARLLHELDGGIFK